VLLEGCEQATDQADPRGSASRNAASNCLPYCGVPASETPSVKASNPSPGRTAVPHPVRSPGHKAQRRTAWQIPSYTVGLTCDGREKGFLAEHPTSSPPARTRKAWAATKILLLIPHRGQPAVEQSEQVSRAEMPAVRIGQQPDAQVINDGCGRWTMVHHIDQKQQEPAVDPALFQKKCVAGDGIRVVRLALPVEIKREPTGCGEGVWNGMMEISGTMTKSPGVDLCRENPRSKQDAWGQRMPATSTRQGRGRSCLIAYHENVFHPREQPRRHRPPAAASGRTSHASDVVRQVPGRLGK